MIAANKDALSQQGKQIFRFDTFGDEAFWGDTLRLHEAIAGAANGGSRSGRLTGAGARTRSSRLTSMRCRLRSPPRLRAGKLDLNDPANTIALLKPNAVVGVTAFLNASGSVRSMGIQCAFCHSTVDDSFAPGHRQPAGRMGES